MKTIYYLFAFSFLLFSCSDDDNETTDPIAEEVMVTEQQLTTVWNLTGYEFFQERGVLKTGIIELPLTITSTGKDFDFTYTLSTDPNLSESLGSFTVETTAVAGPQEFPIEDQVISTNGQVIPGTWELRDDNMLEITEGNNITTYEIVKFSDNTLQLKSMPVTADDFNLEDLLDSGVEAEIQGYFLFTFTN